MAIVRVMFIGFHLIGVTMNEHLQSNDHLSALVNHYLDGITFAHFATGTVTLRSVHLHAFLNWCLIRGARIPGNLSRSLLFDYQRHLLQYRKKNGTPLCVSTQQSQFSSIRAWISWMMRENLLAENPFAGFAAPRPSYRLPQILGAHDIEKVLRQPLYHTRVGLRDRALLETLYSTGVRRTELLRMTLDNIDWHKELVTIRMGKGRKDRVIPIGERALAWLDRYLWRVRRSTLGAEQSCTVFLTRTGKPLTPNHLSALVRHHIEKALPGRSGACHTFRHSMATLMLEGGADIRFIQQMLGHSKLSSTQIYTHVSVRALKEVHSRTHPAARLLAAAREELDESGERK